MGKLLMDNETITLQMQEVYNVLNTLKKIKPDGFKSMDRVVGLVMFFENKMKQANSKQPIEVENNGAG